MIISTILNSLVTFFEDVFTFQIPVLEGVNSILEYIQMIIENGLNLYLFLMPSLSKRLILLVIAVHGIVYIYYFVMWIVKKIPLLSID